MSGSVNRRISEQRFEQGMPLRADRGRILNMFPLVSETSVAEINLIRARKAKIERGPNHVNAVFRFKTGESDKRGQVVREIGPFNVSVIRRAKNEELGQLLSATMLYVRDPEVRRDKSVYTNFWVDSSGFTYRDDRKAELITASDFFGYFRLPHTRHDKAEERSLAILDPEELAAHVRFEKIYGHSGYTGLSAILGRAAKS